MGLDLYVSEHTYKGLNDKKQPVHEVVELDNFRGCHEIVNELDLDNCTSKFFNGDELYTCLNSLKRKLDNVDNMIFYHECTDEEKELQKQRCKIDYKTAIDALEGFLEENKVTDDDTRTFEVHAWW